MKSTQRGFSLIEMILVIGISITVAAIAVPMSGNFLGYFRLTGDARSLSNAVALAKLRAASYFSQSRIYFDLSSKSHHIETFKKSGTPGWVWEGGATTLSQGVSPGYGSLSAAPSSTQAVIGQAPKCLTNDGTAVDNTACIVFNSRGIPIDCSSMSTTGCGSGAPTASDALYLTDGTAVYGITMAATGQEQMWRSPATSATWTKQ